MLCVPSYTRERRPFPGSLYLTSFTLDSRLALTICAQRKTYGWSFTPGPIRCGVVSCDCNLWDESGEGLTGQPVEGLVKTSTTMTVIRHILRGLGELAHDFVRSSVHTRAQTIFGCSHTLDPTSFTLNYPLTFRICAQRKTYGWYFTLCLAGIFFV